jgi:ABC-2 type transport system ATP-binding protein
VETLNAADGRVQLRALPKNGAAIGSELASFIREKSIAVDEIFVERGSLDDVFRQITTSDNGASHA